MTVIKIKNSNVSGRLPSSGDIEVSELALNIADHKLYSKDASGGIFEIGVAGDIPSGAVPPSAGNNNGDLYFNTSTGRLLYWDGSGWQTVVKASGDDFTGDVHTDGHLRALSFINCDAYSPNRIFLGSGINGSQYGFYSTKADGTLAAGIGLDGSGSFARQVLVGEHAASGVSTTGGLRLFDGGTYIATQSSESANVFQGGSITTAATSSIKADGSANFVSGATHIANTGKIECKRNDPDTTNANRNPCFVVKDSDTNVDSVWVANDYIRMGGSVSSNPNIELNKDGTIDCASTITITGGGAFISNRPSADTEDCFRGVGNGQITSSIQSRGVLSLGPNIAGADTRILLDGTDGSANFASTITSGKDTYSGAGAAISPSGNVYLQGTAADVTSASVALQVVNPSVFAEPKATIRHDGSVTFVGDPSAGANHGFQVRETGEVLIKTQSSDALTIYGSGSGKSIRLVADGNAVFEGNITANGTVLTSDARFKENITPAKPQLADVVALGGLLKNYDWNEDSLVNDELRSVRQLGLIAQEAAKVCPAIVKDIKRTKTVEVEAAVTGPKGAVLKKAVTKEEDDSYKGISQDALIMKLIGAVAELSAEVTALKAVKTVKK